jgi:type IV pilus assembly protein PilK
MADSSAGYSQAQVKARPLAGPCLEMDDRLFADWTRLLEQRMGLFIAPERRSFLVSGIRARVRETGCGSPREYFNQMTTGGAEQAREWSMLVDRLTVHETSFFRHQSSMQLVKEQLVPEVVHSERGYLAWSVGCATGEEVYSLAMQIDNSMSIAPGRRFFGVTGTDISLPSLQHARNGIYLKRRLQDIPEAFQHRYCRSISDNRFQIKEQLRKRVCFTQLNLRDLAKAPMAKVDLVYCQNLLIYFDREHRMAIANDLVEFLRPGGVLILGPGELLDWHHSNMEKVCYTDTLAYRRTN